MLVNETVFSVEMTSQSAEIIYTVGWLCIQNNQLLMVRSIDNDAFYVPGGKIEPDETTTEALIREVNEEVNVSLLPDSIEFVFAVRAPAHSRPGIEVQIDCFLPTTTVS